MTAAVAPELADWSRRVPECGAMEDVAENEAYDRIATRWLVRAVYPSLIKALSSTVPNARICDAGSGSGRLALALAQARPGAFIAGVDLSPSMLALARANTDAAGVAQRVTFYQRDLVHTGFADGYCDAAVSYGSLHHWDDPTAVFAELARVVRPGGEIVVGDWRRDPDPLRFFRSLQGTPEWSLIAASAHAAYLEAEVRALLEPVDRLAEWQVTRHSMGILIRGQVRATAPRSPATPIEEAHDVGA